MRGDDMTSRVVGPRRRGRGPQSVARRFCAVAVFVGVCGGFVACSGEPAMRGSAITPVRELPAFSFVRADGSTFRTAGDQDKLTLVLFGYTHCPDVCPTTLSDWTRVKAALGNDASRVRFVFVTVDPERDSADIVDHYVKQFDTAFVGLSGDSATTRAIQEAFGVSAILDATPHGTEHHAVSHSPQLFLLDARGRLAVMYSFGTGWDAVVADVRTLL